MLPVRPLARPVADVVANVVELRRQHRASGAALDVLRRAVAYDHGPAMVAAQPRLRDLRARADADRPYMLAVQDVMSRWADAEQHYEAAAAQVQHERRCLDDLESTSGADHLDIASARAGVKLALMALPATTPAEQFHAELTDALTRRAEAACGAENIVTTDTVTAERTIAMTVDSEAVRAAAADHRRLTDALHRAEAATAKAFAEAETRNATHILDHIEALRTELEMLRASGDYRVERGFSIPAEDTAGLPDDAAHGINDVARSGFTVTPVKTGGNAGILREALRILRDAAAQKDRKVLVCTWTETANAATIHPGSRKGSGPRAAESESDVTQAGVGDEAEVDAQATPSLADLHQQVATGQQHLDANTTIVVDRADQAAPEILADLAEHAAETHARVVLIDHGDRHAPAAPMLGMLHRDLPWSTSLSDGTPTATQQHAGQPDRDAVLEQAERCDPTTVNAEITNAIQERRQLHRRHESGHRFHTERWRLADADQARSRGLSRDAGGPDIGL
jgi:hypothetical protein